MSNLSDKQIEELYELQRDLFYTIDTRENPHLAGNKSLKSSKKTIIGAINQIYNIAKSVESTNATIINRFNNVIGNEEQNPELYEALSKIGNNFYEALFETHKTATDATTDIVEFTKKFNAQIKDLNTKIENISIGGTVDGIKLYNTYEDKLYTGKTFTIACNPLPNQQPAIYINGVHYDNDCFDVSKDGKTFTWNADNDFYIELNYKDAKDDFDVLKTYYTRAGENYVKYEGELDRSKFGVNVIDGYYLVDEDKSDKVIVRYNTYDINNKSYYKTLYDISLLNTITNTEDIGTLPNHSIVNNYDWSGMSDILNKNISGTFKYTNDGNVRIILDLSKSNNSLLITINKDNWDTFKDKVMLFIGGNVNGVNSFEDFCMFVFNTTDVKWVSFFAFELGKDNHNSIFMISSETNINDLADHPAPPKYGTWYYDWDETQVGSEAIAMKENPYIQITQELFDALNK